MLGDAQPTKDFFAFSRALWTRLSLLIELFQATLHCQAGGIKAEGSGDGND